MTDKNIALKVVKDPDLPRSALAIFLFLQTYQTGWDKGMSKLGEKVGLTRMSVFEALRKLEERQLIEKVPHPDRKNWRIYKLA